MLLERYNLATLSESARALDRITRAGAPARRVVALDLDNTALARTLRGLLAGRLDLVEGEADKAAVVIADHDRAGDSAPGRVLRVGAADAPAISHLDPDLILAAATVIAAGYGLERRPAAQRPALVLPPQLSARERQVAELLVDGASNKVIARALDISVHTAKFHVTAILEKLGARNRADAVSIMLREGLLPAG